jgi:hypothetical protein
VTRGDLPLGAQAAQTGHAIAQFFLDHPDDAKKWNNNYLISLSINSERDLQNLLIKLYMEGIPVSEFYEPDLGNQLTSISFIETKETKKFTNKLSLLFKN